LPQRRHAMGHRKRSLPRHRRTREALRRRIHGLEPQLTIKNMVIDGTEVACELSEHLVEGATRVDHIAGSFLRVAGVCASRRSATIPMNFSPPLIRFIVGPKPG